MWDLNFLTRDWTTSPALEGGFLTTGPPGKSPTVLSRPGQASLLLSWFPGGANVCLSGCFITAPDYWCSSGIFRWHSLWCLKTGWAAASIVNISFSSVQIYALNRVMTELEQQQFDEFCKQMQPPGEWTTPVFTLDGTLEALFMSVLPVLSWDGPFGALHS